MLTGKRWELRKPEGESTSGAGGNPQQTDPISTPAAPQGTESIPTDTSPAGSQSPFSHPALAGRTEEEIATLLTVNQAAVREQGLRLSEYERQRNQTQPTNGVQSPIPATQPESTDPADFWKDPMGLIRKEQQRANQEVVRQMQEIIAPFQQDLAAQRANQAWVDVRAAIPDFVTYEPYVRELAKNMGVTEPNAQTLQTLYYTAVGYVAKNQAQVGTAPVNNPSHRPPPPQHSPANQPIPKQQSGKQYRELTENERTLARMRKMTPEQYLDALESEVMEFS